MTETVKFSSIDFMARAVRSPSTTILRRYLCGLDDKEIKIKLWIQEGSVDFIPIQLRLNDYISVQWKQYICPMCHQLREKVDHGRCEVCLDPTNAFSVRLSCMFQHQDSPLEVVGKCTRDDMACGINKNKKYCHSKHVLYLGRYGNYYKVGISRINRRGGYVQRLIEQGLNEAVVIASYGSLPQAISIEKELVNKGLMPRITTDTKIRQLQSKITTNLQELYPFELLEQYFEDKDLIYHQLYDDITFDDLDLVSSNHVRGKIELIRGSLLVIETDEGRMIWNTKETTDRVLTHLVVNQEVIV